MRIVAPTFTQTPNDLFDHWLPHLNETELKVLLILFRKNEQLNSTEIMRFTGLSRNAVLDGINALLEKKFIECCSLSTQEAVDIIKNKTPQQMKFGNQKCEWCGCTTYILQEHHYPIKKCEGGTNFVNICGSCHIEFHFLIDIKKFRIISKSMGV